MLNLLMIVSLIVSLIPIGLAVFSVKVISKHAFTSKMYGFLGIIYFALLMLGISILLASLYLGWPASAFIPPEFIIIFPLFFTIPISIIIIIALSIRVLIRSKQETSNIKLLNILAYLLNTILFPIFFISIPNALISPVGPRCEYKNQDTGNRIIEAIRDYQYEKGDFPESIDRLIPEYLSSIPNDHCDPFDLREFKIIECSNEIFLLTIETMPRDQYQRYDFKNDVWSVSPRPVGDWLMIDEWDTICDGLE